MPELTPIILCTSGVTSRILATWEAQRQLRRRSYWLDVVNNNVLRPITKDIWLLVKSSNHKGPKKLS